MDLLLVAPRCPWPDHSGDRARARMWIDALADRTRMTLVTSPCDCGASDPRIEIVRAERSMTSAAGAMLRVRKGGLPRHTLLTAPYRWGAAIEKARASHEFDVAIVLLTRTDPWVRSKLGAARTILDAVDSAAAGMEQRTRAGGLLSRFWRSEERRTATLEHDLAAHYDAVVVVSEDEATRFDPIAETIGMGIAVQPLVESRVRQFDFGFFGRLAYFANREAVRRLTTSVWPRIRAHRPDATLFIGGADATRDMRALHGRDGIHVESPVADSAEAWRDVRVALLPLSFGSGQAMKTLEAAEAGCAIAGSSCAFRGVSDLAMHSVVEDDDTALASRAIELLARSSAAGLGLREAVEQGHSRQPLLDRMAALAMGEER